MRWLRTWLMALAVVSLVAGGVSPTVASATGTPPVIAASKRYVAPGGPLGLSGAGFQRSELVDVAFGGRAAGSLRADSLGAIGGTVQTPDSVTSGRVSLIATGRFSHRSATTVVQIRVNWPQVGRFATGQGANVAENVLTPASVSGLAVAWSTPAGAFGRPTVFNGLVYVANSTFVTALDAETGAVRWATPTVDAVLGSVVIGAGSAFYGDYLGGFHALDPATGIERWHYQSAGILTLSPVIDDGVVVLAEDDVATFTGLDAATGAVLWHRSANSEPIGADPVVANGIAYLGGGAGTILAVDLKTGTIIWQRHVTTGGVGRMAVANALLVVHFFSNATSAFDAATGSIVWSVTHASPGNPFFSVGGGRVYISVSFDGTVDALDLATGATRWSTTWGGVPLGNAFAAGVLYVGDLNSRLYALDASDGRVITSVASSANMKDGPSIANGFLYLAGTTAFTIPAS